MYDLALKLNPKDAKTYHNKGKRCDYIRTCVNEFRIIQ